MDHLYFATDPFFISSLISIASPGGICTSKISLFSSTVGDVSSSVSIGISIKTSGSVKDSSSRLTFISPIFFKPKTFPIPVASTPYSAGKITSTNKMIDTKKAIIVDFKSCEDVGKSFSDGCCELNIFFPFMN